jgi:hypothetical protein
VNELLLFIKIIIFIFIELLIHNSGNCLSNLFSRENLLLE